MQLRNRHIKLRFAGVFEQHHLLRFAAQVHRHQAHIAPDAVFFVDNGVADADFGKVAEQTVGHGSVFFAARAAAAFGDVLVEVGFGDDGEGGSGFQAAL